MGRSDLGDFRGNPHQVSADIHPGDQVVYSRWITTLVGLFALAATIGGTRAAIVGTELGWRIAAGVLALISLPWTVRFIRRAVHHLRAVYRLRRNRCVHCGYSTKGVRSTKCPECGLDPFEW